jgi:hypothetical protein
MNEFLIALWAMTASHHQWPCLPHEPAAIVRPAEERGTDRELSTEERRDLQTALQRFALGSSGKLVVTSGSGPLELRLSPEK